MLVQEAIDMVRSRGNDVDAITFMDDEIIRYINLGISTVAKAAIREGNPIFIKSVDATSGADIPVPVDFHSFCSGEPCFIENGNLKQYWTPSWQKSVRYFYIPGKVESPDDPIPLPDGYADSAINIALELAAMRISMDVTQERQLHSMMENVKPWKGESTPVSSQSGGGGD